eukprot:7379165-Prymnesium_polylepis.1
MTNSHTLARNTRVKGAAHPSAREKSLPVPSGMVPSGALQPGTFSSAVSSQQQVPSPPHATIRRFGTPSNFLRISSGFGPPFFTFARSYTCASPNHFWNILSSRPPCLPPEPELRKTSTGTEVPSTITSAGLVVDEAAPCISTDIAFESVILHAFCAAQASSSACAHCADGLTLR